MSLVVEESVPTTISRPMISFVSKQLSKLSNDHALDVGSHAIDCISFRHVSFEEEVRKFGVFHINPTKLYRMRVSKSK